MPGSAVLDWIIFWWSWARVHAGSVRWSVVSLDERSSDRSVWFLFSAWEVRTVRLYRSVFCCFHGSLFGGQNGGQLSVTGRRRCSVDVCRKVFRRPNRWTTTACVVFWIWGRLGIGPIMTLATGWTDGLGFSRLSGSLGLAR